MLSPRRIRRYAACVLLVWLFGLGSGIANACIVSAQLRQADAGALMPAHDHAAMAAGDMARADHEHLGHEHGGKLPPPACERLCDAPPAAAQADKAFGQALSAFWLAPAPLAAIAVRAMPRQAAAPPADDVGWAATVPISIAFVRLAL